MNLKKSIGLILSLATDKSTFTATNNNSGTTIEHCFRHVLVYS